jgi:hypothetical protein
MSGDGNAAAAEAMEETMSLTSNYATPRFHAPLPEPLAVRGRAHEPPTAAIASNPLPVRRRADGSIDTEWYIARAHALRADALHRTFGGIWRRIFGWRAPRKTFA